MNLETDNKPVFSALTGVRAIAAYMIFIHHMGSLPFISIDAFNIQKELHIGVTIFFVLSGFLISYRYQDSFSLSSSWFSEYVVKRLARILPVYLLILILSIILDNRSYDFRSILLNV